MGKSKERSDQKLVRGANRTLAQKQLINLDSRRVFEREDDFGILKSTLGEYRKAHGVQRLMREYLRVMAVGGVSDNFWWKYYDKGESSIEMVAHLRAELDPLRIMRYRKLFLNAETIRKRIGYRIHDVDTLDLMDSLKDSGLPFMEVYDEALREQSEMIGLIEMQIDWLRGLPTRVDTAASVEPAQEVYVDGEIMPVVEELPLRQVDGVLLGDKELFWTSVEYSLERHHWLSVPTLSRDVAVSSIEELTRGVRSIKPGSVLRVLEFYAQKSTIQRALGAMNKYEPQERKGWHKVKRGKDSSAG